MTSSEYEALVEQILRRIVIIRADDSLQLLVAFKEVTYIL